MKQNAAIFRRKIHALLTITKMKKKHWHISQSLNLRKPCTRGPKRRGPKCWGPRSRGSNPPGRTRRVQNAGVELSYHPIFPFSPPLPCHPWVSFFPFFSFPHPETLLYPVPPIPTCLVGSSEIHYTLPTTFCYTHHGRMREREKISLGRKIPLYLRGCFSPFPTL